MLAIAYKKTLSFFMALRKIKKVMDVMSNPGSSLMLMAEKMSIGREERLRHAVIRPAQ
jgi:hypothetical protein